MSLENLKTKLTILKEKISTLEKDNIELLEKFGKVKKEKIELQEKFEKITLEVKKHA